MADLTLNLNDSELEVLVGVVKQASGLTLNISLTGGNFSGTFQNGDSATAVFRQTLAGAVIDSLSSVGQAPRITFGGATLTLSFPRLVTANYPVDFEELEAGANWPTTWDDVVGFMLLGTVSVVLHTGFDFAFDIGLVFEGSYNRPTS